MSTFKSVNDAIATVTKAAEAEVGYLEKRTNANLESKTANAGSKNYTKYGKWIGANGDYWCASFISWLFYSVFGETIGKSVLGVYSPACETIRGKLKKVSSPRAGDIVFFTGSRHSGANHIGYIYKVDGGKIYTVEGNTSGASGVVDNGGGVATKSYTVGYTRILSYGRPDYSVAVQATKDTETGSKDKSKKGYSGTFPVLPPRGYYKQGDGISALTNYPTQIKRVQALVNWITDADIKVDGEYGKNTTAAVKDAQKTLGVKVDGQFGKETLDKAKSYKR